MKFTKEQAEDPIRKGDWLFIDDSMVRIDHITLVSPYHENADHPDSVALYFNTGEAKAFNSDYDKVVKAILGEDNKKNLEGRTREQIEEMLLRTEDAMKEHEALWKDPRTSRDSRTSSEKWVNYYRGRMKSLQLRLQKMDEA